MGKRKLKIECRLCHAAQRIRRLLSKPVLRHDIASAAIVIAADGAWRAFEAGDYLNSASKLSVIVLTAIVGLSEEI